MRPRWNSSHSREGNLKNSGAKKKQHGGLHGGLKKPSRISGIFFFFSLGTFSLQNFFWSKSILTIIPTSQFDNFKRAYLFGVKNIIIIQGHAIVTIGWCSNNTHVVGISNTRQMNFEPGLFHGWFSTDDRHFWSKLMVDFLFGLTLRIRCVKYPHSSSVGF